MTNESSDYIPVSRQNNSRIMEAFLGPLGLEGAETIGYISPAGQTPVLKHVSFAGFPRTFITSGGREVLLDQIVILKERMERDMPGGQVQYHEMPEALHDALALPWFEPERSVGLRKISEWNDL